MPTINRIRIINFSYNNDTRHIMDECFNFHGGENGLLNLANGGGKSVLVQLFLQPVVPGIRIQKRNIADFFRRQKQPTFLMLEWKLDAGGGYFLTGIALIPAEATGAEEGKGKVRYFTFTSKYTSANAFDILRIPLAEKRGNLLHLLSFREARELMRDKQQKDPYLFGYFPEDEGASYSKHLAEFGIVQEEWRNVIAKINDSEGGIEEIFQRYKSSSQLLDEWIIKNIEKSLFKEKAEVHRLEEMLEKLVQEVAENERFLVERELFSNFLISYGEQIKGLSGLLQGLEEQRVLSEKLAALNAYLTVQLAILEQKAEENEREREIQKLEEQRIILEERSQEYIQKKYEYKEAQELLALAEKRMHDTDDAILLAQMAGKIQQAARLRDEICQKEAKLSGVEEHLASAKAVYNKDQRIGELEYSLKRRLEEELNILQKDENLLQADKQRGQTALQQVKSDLKSAEEEKSALDRKQGQLAERKDTLEEYISKTLEELALHLRRNLLGELEQAELGQIKNEYSKADESLELEKAQLTAEQDANNKLRQGLKTKVEEIQGLLVEENAFLTNLRRDIQEYEHKETEVKKILENYGFLSEWRFEPERLNAEFSRKIQTLADSVEKAGINWHDAQENILSLKNGCLHVPVEWVELLSSLDIQYNTGETYLRGLPAELCFKMLEANPLLPYAFILTRSDIERLGEAIGSLTMKRVIPLIAYEDLGLEIESSQRIIRTNQGITLACLYEGRIFTQESLAKLIVELEYKSKEAFEQREHYGAEHQKTVTEQAICARFTYGADYAYNLGLREKAGEVRLEGYTSKIILHSKEMESLEARQDEIVDRLRAIQGEQQRIRDKAKLFDEFLLKDQEYEICCRELNKVLENYKVLNNRKSELEEQQKILEKKLSEFKEALRNNEKQHREKQEQYLFYQNASETKLVKGNTSELTARLQVLKTEYNQEIGVLEQRKKELLGEVELKTNDLRKLDLKVEDYISVRYEEEQVDSLRREVASLESLAKEYQGELNKASGREGATKEALKTAWNEVKRLGYENPLPPEEILGDFAERRKSARKRLKELERENEQLQQESIRKEGLKNEIQRTFDLKEIDIFKGFVPEPDLEAQTKNLGHDYNILDKQNRKDIGVLRNQYGYLKENYREKNTNIDNIFRGVDQLWESALLSDESLEHPILAYDHFYYLYERMSAHQEKLSELLTIYEMQLANLERNKRDMVEQSFLHGMRIFEEIQWISDNSKVRLQGRNRPVQMLKIDLTLDSKENAKERMKAYIEEAISKVRQESRQNKKEEEIRRSVIKLMSSREVLNVYLGNSHIPVSVFKIEYNMHNSRLKLWEDAVRENSGGEKFVVFFSVLSALMGYARTRAMEGLGGVSDQDTSVLIMDNPFGPISSEHLLNPLFEIAKKHRTQLICLSDLKQNSIMNCFNLIYMLKIRTSAIGNQEYLKFEEVIRDVSALQDDERLEKAFFRTETKQMAMFGEE